jgi:hypothetical protein
MMERPSIFDDEVSHEDIIAEFRSTISDDINKVFSDHDCIRFLKARGGSVVRASQMANAWHIWRHSFLNALPPHNIPLTPNTILASPNKVPDHPRIDLLPIMHMGHDRDGRPIYWERTGYIQSRFTEVFEVFTVDELIQFHISSNESFECRLDYYSKKFNKQITNTIVVFDMKYLMMTLNVQSIQYIKDMLGIDQAYYPERLYRLFIINAPWYFSALFAIFKPFIDKRTADKFIIVGSDFLASLTEYIDLNNIPQEYGGTMPVSPWGGPFPEESGTSYEQIDNYVRSKYPPDKVFSLLTPEEIRGLEQAAEITGIPTGLTPEQKQRLHIELQGGSPTSVTASDALPAAASQTSNTTTPPVETAAAVRAPPHQVQEEPMKLLQTITVRVIRAEVNYWMYIVYQIVIDLSMF